MERTLLFSIFGNDQEKL